MEEGERKGGRGRGEGEGDEGRLIFYKGFRKKRKSFFVRR
jgi:hypothetical protein